MSSSIGVNRSNEVPNMDIIEHYLGIFSDNDSGMNIGSSDGSFAKFRELQDLPENRKSECAKALYAATHMEDIPTDAIQEITDLFREQVRIGVEQNKREIDITRRLSDLILTLDTYNGNRQNPEDVYIQEIVAQRLVFDFLHTVEEALLPKYEAHLFASLVESIRNNETENARFDRFRNIVNSNILSLEGGVPTYSELYEASSVGAKVKLHVWSVILFVEAVYRVAIEAVAYAIHLLVPQMFGQYTVEEGLYMVIRQWESVEVLAHAIVSPGRALDDGFNRSFEAYRNNHPSWRNSLDEIRRGTPDNSADNFTASLAPSNFWPQLQQPQHVDESNISSNFGGQQRSQVRPQSYSRPNYNQRSLPETPLQRSTSLMVNSTTARRFNQNPNDV
jgi:hypothetical protein